MIRAILLCWLFVRLTAAQTASFPGSVSTDDQLKVAVNDFQTTLKSPLGAGDPQVCLRDAAGVVPSMLLTIDTGTKKTEIVSVVSVDSATCLTVVRGFDGTAAVAHSQNASVRANITAWHHNKVTAEVKAIETALGPGLSNLTTDGSSILSQRYDFPAQAPGGSLVAGVVNVVTLAPVPQGLSGTDVGHWVYLSGGTGTAEAVLITGGTAIAGAPSGTINFTPAFAHSGAWLLRSATAGVQESVNIAQTAGRGRVSIPVGVHAFYGPVRVIGGNIHITGASKSATTILLINETDGFRFEAHASSFTTNYNDISNLFITRGAQGGSAGIGLALVNQYAMNVKDVDIFNVANGILMDNCTSVYVSYVEIRELSLGSTFYGVRITGTGAGGANTFLDHTVIVGSGLGGSQAVGINIRTGGGTHISNSDVILAGTALLIDPASGNIAHWVFINGTAFDTCTNDGIRIVPTGTGIVKSVVSTGDWTASHGGNGVIIAPQGASTVTGVAFIGLRAFGNGTNGVLVGTGTTSFSCDNCRVTGNSTAVSGAGHGISINPNVTDFSLTNNWVGAYDSFTSNQQGFGIIVQGGSSDRYTITGNHLMGNITAAFSDGGTGMVKNISGNLPSSANSWPTSCTSQPTKTVWNDAGTLKVCP